VGPATKPRPKPLECRRGFVKRKLHGKARCVRVHEAAKPGKKKHRKHAA